MKSHINKRALDNLSRKHTRVFGSLFLTSAALLSSALTASATLVVTFDGTSIGNWTTSGGTLSASSDALGTGENGIIFTDGAAGVSFYQGTDFTGDLSSEIDQTIRFGVAVNDAGQPWAGDLNPDIRIVGSAGTAELDILATPFDSATIPAFNTAFDFDIALTAANFGKTPLEFSAIMADVTRIEIRAEFWSGVAGVVESALLPGAPVPEPSSAALLGLGGLALILRRRK